MFNFLFDQLPWWTIPVVIAVLAGLTYPLWGTIWNTLPRGVQAFFAAVGATVVAFLYGRRKGRIRAQDEQKARDARAERTRTEVDHEVSKMDTAAREREWDRWLRDDKRK